MSRARDIANYGDGIDTSSITSGTFADARIAQSNVTQHEGSIDALASNPTITLGSNTTISKSGMVIQALIDDYYIGGPVVVTDDVIDDYLGSNLQVTITPTTNGNKLFVQCFVCDVYAQGDATAGLNAGFRYHSDFSGSNGTKIGARDYIGDHQGYGHGGLLTNMTYSVSATIGTDAPSAGSASIIRPFFEGQAGDMKISANGASGFGGFSLLVMEIKS